MDCDMEKQEFDNAGLDPKTKRLKAIALAICQLDCANSAMIARNVIGSSRRIEANNGVINDLRQEALTIKATQTPFGAIPAASLASLAAAISKLEGDIATSHLANDFAVSCQGLVSAITTVVRS